MTTHTHDHQSRLDNLQFLRFIAAALVLTTHTTFYIGERAIPSFMTWHGGEVGVPIFFVISGAVMIISTQGQPFDALTARLFAINRISRIVPPYWTATALKIVATMAIPSAVLHNHFDIPLAIKSFLFIPTFNSAGEMRPIHGVGWTLIHEMYFYALFVLSLSLRLNPAYWVSSAILIALLLSDYLLPYGPLSTLLSNWINFYFILGILVGKLVTSGRFSRNNPESIGNIVGICATVTLFCAGFYFKPIHQALDLRVYAAAVFMILSSKLKFIGAGRWFVALGGSSYSLYLFHPLIAPLLVTLLSKAFLPRISSAAYLMVITIPITIFVSHLIFVLYEHPATRHVKLVLNRMLLGKS